MNKRLSLAVLIIPAALAAFVGAGCKSGGAGGDVSPAAFRSDSSKMTPEAKRLMEESMRSARQAPPSPAVAPETK